MTIQFKGQTYASQEDMPKDVARDYEEFLLEQELGEALEQQNNQAKSAALPRAWGGANAGGGVPVPVEFDGVTNLGPAATVYEPQGMHLPHMGTPHATVLVIYRDGFAFRTGDKTVHAWRFDELAGVQSNVDWSRRGAELHEYTLFRSNNEMVVLDNGIKGAEEASDAIKDAMLQRLGPAYKQHYQAGEALTFGPVTVQQQAGLQVSGQRFAWDTIQNIQVQNGQLQVTLRNGKHSVTRVAAIPNIELLGALIGIDRFEMQLSYIG